MINAKKNRKRKTDKLTKVELIKFRSWVKSQITKLDAADELEISVVTLRRIMNIGRGNPLSIQKIRNILNR